MRHLVWPMVALLLGCSQLSPKVEPGELNSGLQIPPRERFILGGGQRGEFSVAAHNQGPVEVEVAALKPDGSVNTLTTVKPDGVVRQKFAPGDAALFINRSGMRAKLFVAVNGDVQLGMRFADAFDPNKPARE